MKLTPGPITNMNPPAPTSNNSLARERAIAKITGASTEAPVAQSTSALVSQQPIPLENPNNISVEELGALRAPNRPAPMAEEPATVEEPAETAPQTEEQKSYSSQLAQLAKKERALRAKALQQQQALKAREEALKTKEAELAAKAATYDSDYIPKQKLKERTLEALAEAGVTYDEVTQQQINAGTVPPAVQAYIDKLEARQAKLEAQIEETRGQSAKQQDEAYKAAIRQITADARTLVTTDPNFETVRETGSVKDVVELIEATFKESGRVMSVEEAASLVEEHLLEEIDKLTRIEKIKRRLQPKPATAATVETKQPTQAQKQPQTMKTLTNAAASTRPLSARERAILAFKGELKS